LDNTIIPALLDIADRAGAEIMKIYATDFDVETKGDDSPLTAADMAAHHCIVEGLKALTPDIPVLSEESGEITWAERQSWDQYWLVDPLDGTKEFVKKSGEFTVNIALIENHVPVMGVVHVPATKVSYYGTQIGGAYRRDAEGIHHFIQARKVAREPVIVVGSKSHRTPETDSYLEKLGPHEITSMGSSLKFCLVADGSADVYPRIGLTCEWDTAAAQAVVEAAGGLVTDTELKPLRYNTKDEYLNPHFLVFADLSRDWAKYLD